MKFCLLAWFILEEETNLAQTSTGPNRNEFSSVLKVGSFGSVKKNIHINKVHITKQHIFHENH